MAIFSVFFAFNDFVSIFFSCSLVEICRSENIICNTRFVCVKNLENAEKKNENKKTKRNGIREMSHDAIFLSILFSVQFSVNCNINNRRGCRKWLEFVCFLHDFQLLWHINSISCSFFFVPRHDMHTNTNCPVKLRQIFYLNQSSPKKVRSVRTMNLTIHFFSGLMTNFTFFTKIEWKNVIHFIIVRRLVTIMVDGTFFYISEATFTY